MKETNDCTVKAWFNVFNAPYHLCHKYLKGYGRVHRRGMTLDQIKRALNGCKKTKVVYGPYSDKNRITVTQFCKKHPVGRYYVTSRGHAFAIIDGVVHDWHHGPRRQIKFAARVYLGGAS